jgi:hypothetical protein
MPVRRSSFSFGFNQVALENHWTFPGLTQPLKGGKLYARQGFRTARKDPLQSESLEKDKRNVALKGDSVLFHRSGLYPSGMRRRVHDQRER